MTSNLPGPPKVPKIVAQYPNMESLGSIESIILGSSEAPSQPGMCPPGFGMKTDKHVDSRVSQALSGGMKDLGNTSGVGSLQFEAQTEQTSLCQRFNAGCRNHRQRQRSRDPGPLRLNWPSGFPLGHCGPGAAERGGFRGAGNRTGPNRNDPEGYLQLPKPCFLLGSL